MTKQRLHVTFSKKGLTRFISHLDLIRLFQRAVRRAELPVALTEGFSPRSKLSFKRALKLGAESDGEEVIFYIDGWIRPEEFRSRLQTQLPEGIRVMEVKLVSRHA